jgi:hypothetical protein
MERKEQRTWLEKSALKENEMKERLGRRLDERDQVK